MVDNSLRLCLMARRHKRLWTAEEKRSICHQAQAPGVSVAQVARRYSVNANLIFKWLRDPRFAPEPDPAVEVDPGAEAAVEPAVRFLPVELITDADHPHGAEGGPKDDAPAGPGDIIEIELAGGHRLRITGRYDPEALARLLRGLSR